MSLPDNVGVNSVQASSLLKLMPECTAVSPSQTSEPSANRRLLNSVFALLKTQYVEPITADRETEMAHGAVRGMMNSLADPDSRFLDNKARRLIDDAANGRLHGIGAVLALKKEKVGALDVTKLVVITPMTGSPADKAGLKPGDSITELNGKWIITYDPFREDSFTKLEKAVRNKDVSEFDYQKAFEKIAKKLKDGMTISEALDLLTVKDSGELSMKVERAGASAPVQISASCRPTSIDGVDLRMLDRKIAYIRISQFNKRSAQEFASQLSKAQSNHAKAVILDLRNDPGGLINSASAVMSRLTGGGVVGAIQEKKSVHKITTPNMKRLNLPMVVLVNGGTASVSELVAGTLHDRGVATIVGTKTFGDGLTQTPLLLKDGTMAVLTTGKMLTAKGHAFEGKGIMPDKTIYTRPGADDLQLSAAKNILLKKLGKA